MSNKIYPGRNYCWFICVAEIAAGQTLLELGARDYPFQGMKNRNGKLKHRHERQRSQALTKADWERALCQHPGHGQACTGDAHWSCCCFPCTCKEARECKELPPSIAIYLTSEGEGIFTSGLFLQLWGCFLFPSDTPWFAWAQKK